LIWWTGFPSHKVDDIWGRAEPLLRKGFESPELADGYYERVKAAHAQLWCVFDDTELLAAFLTEIHTIGGRKVCNVIAASGRRMSEWLHLLEVIENWARQNGCEAMRHANCRKGWAKRLPGYETTRIVLEKGL
jgi:hypothetical protein